jgi:hypothetical protein
MRRLLIGATTLALFFTACEPGHEPEPEPAGTVKLLSTDVTDSDSSIFSYDTSKAFFLFEQHELSDGFTIFLQPVFVNKRLTGAMVGLSKSSITSKFKTFNYNRIGKAVSVYSYEYGFNQPARIDSLVYDVSGRLITSYAAAITSAGGTIGFFQKDVFEWDTQGNNIIKKYSIGMENGELTGDTTTTVYTYDNKVNYVAKQPDYGLMQLEEAAGVFSANNVLVATSTIKGIVNKESSNVYTYDSDNYPVRIITTEKEFYNGVVVDTREYSHRLTYIKL